MAERRTAAEPSLIGRRLGDFVIQELIGEGGYGRIYLAAQTLLERQAVIKILHPRRKTRESVIQRFLDEARLASRIDHPYAAHIYAFGAESDGLMWIAMELVRGVTLSHLIAEQGPVPLERFVPFLGHLCEVVHTVHEQGIVHSDVKPENVMVISRAGRLLPKLLDLGIAHDIYTMASSDTPPHGTLLPPDEQPGSSPGDSTGHRSRTVSGSMPAVRADTLPPGTSRGDTPSPSRIRASLRRIQGSPHYMAPEQWYAPGSADRRTDIYALGVLCFVALTGYPPFWGKSTTAIARGHAKKPVPPLGDGFPAGLDEVLSKAMAKRQEHRFDSAIEFATVFSEAAGVRTDVVRLPELESTVSRLWMTSAPQPLAEAIAMLDSARNLHQAGATVREVASLLAHYVGTIALAGWMRASTRTTLPAAASDVLRQIHQRDLSGEEWIELARELLRPFAATSDLFCMPELVQTFFASGRAETGSPGPFAELFAALESQPDIDSSDEELRDYLGHTVTELAGQLSALRFLLDYPLVVATRGPAEKWMGIRRIRRPAFELTENVDPDTPVLIDASGTPVVSLHPLVQAATPVAGASRELFWLTGPSRRGARLVARPRAFEHRDPDLWEWLRTHGLPALGHDPTATEEERAPFRGLSSFSAADADLFFGRELEAQRMANRLQLQAMIAVVGPSGAGKSSFVQAGVAPLLPDDWHVVTMRPGVSPAVALVSRIDDSELDVVWNEPRDASDIARAIRRAVVARESRLLLIVDQFEELFTLCQDSDERAEYAEILTELAQSPDDPIRVVVTLRDDFLMKAQSLYGLRDRLTHSLQLVATPDRDDLLRILLEPAHRVGYHFEDDELPEQMVDEVGDHPGALALLSFSAAQLWELRDRQSKELRRVAYETMGGVGGALAHHADSVLAKMSADQLLVVREAFRNLVTAQGTRAVLARNELDEVLGGGSHSEGVVEMLVAARLLVAREGPRGTKQIEITHEALIADWPQLAKWRREDAEGARLRDELRAAARHWDERGRKSWLLWRGEALTEYQLWRARFPGSLTRVEREFAVASRKHEARGRQLRRAALISVFVALSIGLVITLGLRNRAVQQRQRAEASEQVASQRLLDLRVEQARQAFVHDEPLNGLAYLRDAMERGAKGPVVRYLLARGTRALAVEELSLSVSSEMVHRAMFIGDERIVTAALDKPAQVWDAATGELLHDYDGSAVVLAMSPDSSQLATGGGDGSVRIWRPDRPEIVRELAGADRAAGRGTFVYCIEFSRDGKYLVTGRRDGKADVWDVASGERIVRLDEHTGPVLTCSFNRDASQVITAGGQQRIWDRRTGALLHVIGASGFRARAELSPDTAAVVTSEMSSSVVQVWDAATGTRSLTLETDSVGVQRATYSPDGQRILIAGADGSAQLWSATTGARELRVRGHDGVLWWAGFSPDQSRLVTTSNDRRVMLWDAASGERLATFSGHLETVVHAAFNATGDRIVSVSLDGTAKVWSTRSTHESTTYDAGGEHVVATVFSPDGRRVLTRSRDRILRLWRVDDGALLATYDAARREVTVAEMLWYIKHRGIPAFHPSGELVAVPIGSAVQLLDGDSLEPVREVGVHDDRVTSVTFSRDGQHLLTASEDNTARLWSLDSGEQRQLFKDDAAIYHAAISSNGNRVATGGDSTWVRIWDAHTGRLLQDHRDHGGPITALAFSPDGATLASASFDTTIRIWKLATGKPVVTMETLSAALGVAFSPDGGLLAVIESTGHPSVWDPGRGIMLEQFGSFAEFGYWIAFAPGGDHVAISNGTAQVWDASRDRRPIGEIHDLLGRRLPYILRNERLVPNRGYAPSNRK